MVKMLIHFLLHLQIVKKVISITSSLSDNKSSGPNSTLTRILELLKKDISTQLVEIFNLCFSSGMNATSFRISKVIPIHKKTQKFERSNCRRIWLLSNIGKISEKLTHKRPSNFLDTNNLIYSLQFGFRQNWSPFYALIHLTETMKQSYDQGLFSCGIVVDLQKAFNTADHNILLGKLEHYEIRGIIKKWFEICFNQWLQFRICVNAIWCPTRVCFESFTIPFVYQWPVA